MSYAREREEFIHLMSRLGWRLDAIRSVLRDAGIVQRAAEVDCSVSHEGIRAASMKANASAERRLIETAAKHVGTRVEFQGDPRGCCVKLHVKGEYIGGNEKEIGVPAQGYRVSQMDRMTK